MMMMMMMIRAVVVATHEEPRIDPQHHAMTSDTVVSEDCPTSKGNIKLDSRSFHTDKNDERAKKQKVTHQRPGARQPTINK